MADTNRFEEQKSQTIKTLARMLDYLKLEATDLRAEEKNGKIAVKIASGDAGRIIGRNGQNLDNLQYMLNLVMFKSDKECPRIVLDIDGYAKGAKERPEKDGGASESGEPRERRERGGRRERHSDGPCEEDLRQQALDAAKEVRRWGDDVTLPEMNAHDRRIIHVTLQEEGDIKTESIGEGAYKKVVISLKKD